jgi:EmrB/QacA subfamily drug resistance transporter
VTERTTQPPAFADRPPIELPHPVRMRILGAVMIGIFLAALDQTVVGTALPRIITDLGGMELYTWAFTAYLLTSTISGPLYGKLSDLFGRRPIFLFGIGIFMVGSIGSALSQEMWQLIAARGVQGLGAGALFPIALAVIGDLFSPSERGKYQGLFGAVFGLSVLIGPAIGGLLTDTVGWPWVFFFNLPIGAIVFAIVWRSLPSYHLGSDRPSIDFVGAGLFTAALVPILVGLTNKQSADWTAPSVGGLIAVGAVIGLVFVLWESRAREPIVPLSLFRNRTFTLSVIAFFLSSFGFLAAVVFLPRWFQVVNGSSATESGYQILPLLGGLIISATAAGQIVSRTGRYRLMATGALLTMAAGLLLLTNLRADTPIPLLWIWMFIAGIGVGPTFGVFTLIVQNSVRFDQMGAATSNLTFFQQVGGTVGLAITGTIFGTTLGEEVPRRLAGADLPPQMSSALAGGGFRLDAITGVGDLGAAILGQVPEAFRAQVQPFIPTIVQVIHEAISVATASTFYIGIAAAVIAAGFVLMLKEVPIRHEEPAAASNGVAPGRALGEPGA